MEQLGLYTAAIALHYAEGHRLPAPPTNTARIISRESAAPLVPGSQDSPHTSFRGWHDQPPACALHAH